MAKTGRHLVFHGAFKTKGKAVRKEKSEKGDFILERNIRGKKRFLVLSAKPKT
jgi:hypothetical protein